MIMIRILFFIILVGILVGCHQNKKQKEKNNTSIIQKHEVSAKDTLTLPAEKKQKLTTQNAIPFLYEYEKNNKERNVRIITPLGNIDIELYQETPYHRANFVFLVKQKYFDGTCFHRVVKDFIIQGGNADSWDISRKRRDIGSYLLPPDTKKGFKHHRGTISMPSSDIDNPHQFASPYEFFIVCQKPGAYHLDKGYTAFGRVTHGMEVVDKINSYKVDQREWPIENIPMKVILLD